MTSSAQVIETELLSALPAADVLRFLDERAKVHAGQVLPGAVLAESLVQALYQRDERLIDIGLARAADKATVARVLQRRSEGELGSPEFKPDAAVLIAALSGLSVGDWYEAPGWLKDILRWLARHGVDDQLEALFQNPGVTDDVVQSALTSREQFSELAEDRALLIASMALRSERVAEGVKDDSFGPDLVGWDTQRAVWDFVAKLDPTNAEHARTLAYFLARIPREFHVPRHFELEPVSGSRTRWKEEQFAFLKYLIDRWSPDLRGEDVGNKILKIREVRELIASHAPQFNELIKPFLRDHQDLSVRRGFYRSVRDVSLDDLRAFHAKDGDHFSESAAFNPFFGRRSNRELSLWLTERLGECKAPKREYDLSAEDHFADMLEEWNKKEPDRYFANRWEIIEPQADSFSANQESLGTASPFERQVLTQLNDLKSVVKQRHWLGWLIAGVVGFLLAKI